MVNGKSRKSSLARRIAIGGVKQVARFNIGVLTGKSKTFKLRKSVTLSERKQMLREQRQIIRTLK